MQRSRHNPILSPRPDKFWESRAVFNCATILTDGKVHMLYRAIGEYEHYISRLGYAVSEDFVNFTRFNEPAFGPNVRYELGGCEDPRLMKIDDKIYMTYVVLPIPQQEKGIASTALASTSDFHHYYRYGIITPDNVDDKDVVLFPEKINGNYVMAHRPDWVGEVYRTERPSIWLAYSENLHNWTDHHVLLRPIEEWEIKKIGVGPPPIKTKDGWLLIYHGVDYNDTYRVGAALLDLKDPSHVIVKTRQPLLEPEETYERVGDIPNVVFPTGAILLDNELFVYYGAADKVICLATVELDVLLDYLPKLST